MARRENTLTLGAPASILSRWPLSKSAVIKRARTHADAVTTAYDSYATELADLRHGGALTAKGIKDAAQKMALAKVLPSVKHAASDALPLLSGEIAKLRQQAMGSKPDKSDVAAAMLRAEIRDRFRAMTPGQRAQVLAVADPEVSVALLEGPAMLSGLSAPERELLQEAAVRHLAPETLTDIEALEEARAVLAGAVTVIRQETAREAGWTAKELDDAMAGTSATVPVSVIDLDNGRIVERQQRVA